MAKDTRSESYPDAPGVALIVNIEKFDNYEERTRQGARHDEHYFAQLFGCLGFEVIRERNSTWRDFVASLHAAMKYFIDDKYFSGPFFLCIMTHGTEAGLLFSDNETIPMDRIMSLLMEDHCKNLENRAKLILIQSCRGREFLTVQSDGTAKPKTYHKPDYEGAADRWADILVFRSCVENRLSFLSAQYGSRFVCYFCCVFLTNLLKKGRCEILDVTREVIQKMTSNLVEFQEDKVFVTPQVTTMTLAKNLYFSLPRVNLEQAISVLKQWQNKLANGHLDQDSGRLTDDGSTRDCLCNSGCRPSSKCRCQRQGRPCGPGCHQAADAPCFNKTTRCSCDSTCLTNKCGCFKAGGSCGRDCHPRRPTMCQNTEVPSTAAAAPAGRGGRQENEPGVSGQHRNESNERHDPPDAGLIQTRAVPHSTESGVGDDAPTCSACGCKTGCGTRRCGCVKAGAPCTARCHPKEGDCQNTPEHGSTAKKIANPEANLKTSTTKLKEAHSSGGSSYPKGRDIEESEDEDASNTCGCKTGCGTRRCGCVKAGLTCSSKCHPKEGDCQNKHHSSTATKIVSPNTSPAKFKEAYSSGRSSSPEGRDIEESEDEDASNTCGCKTGCGTRRCGCVKAGLTCSSKCHPKEGDCQNKQSGSSTKSIASSGSSRTKVKELLYLSRSDSDSRDGEDSESSDAATTCGCKTGCNTRRCGCVKAGQSCTTGCHPKDLNCANRAGS